MKENNSQFIVLSFLLIVIISFYSLLQGAYKIEPLTVIRILSSKIISLSKDWTDEQEFILIQVRIPRILLVALVGSNLAISGAVLQAVFKNPLVSPFILGISSGASLGASIIIIFLNIYNPFLLQFSAFAFGLLAVFLVIGISKIFSKTTTVALVLCGVIVSSLFSSLVSLLQYFTESDKLQAVIFWMFGGFSNSNWESVLQVLPFTIIGSIILVLISWRINVISLGDQHSETLGINSKRFRIILIIIVSLMTSSAIAICGPIGWVGLVIPHIVRMLMGSNNYYVLIGSLNIGASFLLIMELISRNLLSVEIPIGIVTAIIGAPFFIYVLSHSKHNL